MPKIPSDRVGFCESCGAAIPWGTRFCPTCRSAPSVGQPALGVETQARFLYRALPFTAMTTGSKSITALTEAATTQFQSLLSRLDLEGWEFVRVENVAAVSAPGCLGMLRGAKEIATRIDMVIVRRPR